MNRELKYLAIATLLFLFAIMIAGCSEIQQKMRASQQQMTCTSSTLLGCAGWKTGDNDD